MQYKPACYLLNLVLRTQFLPQVPVILLGYQNLLSLVVMVHTAYISKIIPFSVIS